VELFTAFDRLQTSLDQYKELYQQNVTAIREHLLKKHKFELSAADMDQLEGIYFAFFWEGPDLRYSMSPTGIGQRFGGSNFPSYEENYRYIKSLEERNLIVPIVGNFAGQKALRAVGKYIRDRGSVVSAFYVSNVEQYLFQDSLFDEFAKNVATLPLDGQSTFIRSVSTRFGYSGAYLWTDGRASALDPMAAFVRDFQAEKIKSYYDVNARSK
jgi:hypothetical protein